MIDANDVFPMGEQGTQQNPFDTQQNPFDSEPIALTRTVQLPPFPADSLPKPVADMVHAVGEATQTDPAMAGTTALSTLSACTGGHAEIEIRSGWREPLCTYNATVAEPGERKSAVQQAMTRPLLDAEQQLVDVGTGARLEAETRKQVAAKAAEKRKHTAAAKANTEEWDAAMADDGVYIDGPCHRCVAFAARLDTGLCEWCTAEEKRSLCQCVVCVKRRVDELIRLQTRPPYSGAAAERARTAATRRRRMDAATEVT